MSSLKEKRKRIQFVYKTTNLLNGTYYIGVHSTWNIDDGYLGSGKRLGRAIKKYGKENFKREILSTFETNREAYDYEAYLVNEELLKDELCLNLKPGGNGGFCNKEHQLKCSLAGARSGAKKSNEIQSILRLDPEWSKRKSERISKATKGITNFKGKSHNEETKALISEKAKERIGDKNSQFGTCWITNGTQNKKIRKGDSIPEGWSLGRNNKRVVTA